MSTINKFMDKICLAFILLIITTDALSHGGRTNSSGCHNNRKTGGYHCHNGYSSSYSQENSLYSTPKEHTVKDNRPWISYIFDGFTRFYKPSFQQTKSELVIDILESESCRKEWYVRIPLKNNPAKNKTNQITVHYYVDGSPYSELKTDYYLVKDQKYVWIDISKLEKQLLPSKSFTIKVDEIIQRLTIRSFNTQLLSQYMEYGQKQCSFKAT